MTKVHHPKECLWQRGERVVFTKRIPSEAHYGLTALPGDAGTVLGSLPTKRPMIVSVALDVEREFSRVIQVAETVLESKPGPA